MGDLAESFHFVKYKRQENTMAVFADDVSPRWLTATAVRREGFEPFRHRCGGRVRRRGLAPLSPILLALGA